MDLSLGLMRCWSQGLSCVLIVEQDSSLKCSAMEQLELLMKELQTPEALGYLIVMLNCVECNGSSFKVCLGRRFLFAKQT